MNDAEQDHYWMLSGIKPRGIWNGQIDDVRIYSRALGATEIQQLAAPVQQ